MYSSVGHIGVLGEGYKVNSLPLEEGQEIISGLGSYANTKQRPATTGGQIINSLSPKINYK